MPDGSSAVPFVIPWDSFAAYFARGNLSSNFESMCRSSAFGNFEMRRQCRVCEGLGFRVLAAEKIGEFGWRISHARTERDREELRAELDRASFCHACRGIGTISQRPKRRAKKSLAHRMDGMLTTVMCAECRGFDAREHPELPSVHWGTSAGEVRLYGTRGKFSGPRHELDEVVSDPRDDAAADRGDKCGTCGGDAYIVPITARPTLRTSDAENQGEDGDEPTGYFETEAAVDGDAVVRAVEWIAENAEGEFLGLRVLSGEHGERWAASDWERSFALWPLEQAGQRLAEGSRGHSNETDPFARDLDLIAHERHAYQASMSDDRREALISQADVAALRHERRVRDAVLRACKAVA